MHDIKLIRKNPDFFSKKISERNVKFDLNNLLKLDNKNRKLIQLEIHFKKGFHQYQE